LDYAANRNFGFLECGEHRRFGLIWIGGAATGIVRDPEIKE
jgi:hypothetical protein